MIASFTGSDSPPRSPRRPQAVSNAVLGMLIFVMTELMLFAGFISAFTIVRAGAGPLWPPPGQPRLPLEATALNTTALLLSGAALYAANRAHRRGAPRVVRPLLLAILLGGFFVLSQGLEWIALIREGLTLTSSTLGSFFYLIVGAHALHALGGLAFLAHTSFLLRRSELEAGRFHAAQIFWYFVVGLWPVLYWRVYL